MHSMQSALVTVGTCIWALNPVVAKGTAVVMKGVAEFIYKSQQSSSKLSQGLV